MNVDQHFYEVRSGPNGPVTRRRRHSKEYRDTMARVKDRVYTRDAPEPDLLVRRATIEPGSIDEANRTVRVVFSTGSEVQRRDLEGPFIERLSLAEGHVNLAPLRGASVLNSHRQQDLHDVLGTVEEAWTDGAKGWARIKISARSDVEPIWQDIKAGIIKSVSCGYTVQRWRDDRQADGRRVRIAEQWTPRELSFVAVGADADAQVRGADQQVRQASNEAIRAMAAAVGIEPAYAEGLVTRGLDADGARHEILDELTRRAGPEIQTQTVPSVVMGEDYSDISTRAAHIGEALYCRVNPAYEPSAPARQYIGLSMPEIGREILRAHGMSVTALSPATIVTRALHTTSDFSLILADTVGRTLRMAYGAAPAGVRSLAKQTTARDFRTKHRLMLGEAPTLEKVNEHGEFKSGTMAEAEETYKAETFGRIIGISRQAIVNDDLGAFSDLSARLGVSAAEFEAQHLVDLLTKNAGNGPTMKDGQPLFDSTHGNQAAAGGALSETTLSAGRLAMRSQSGLSGKPINVTPRTILVPAALETTAEKIVATIQAATTADVNPFAGRLNVVVDSRLDAVSATRWYLVADPSQIDGLEYCYLEGAQGPQIESQNGFRVDGVEIRVRLDYGCGFVEHRSWYENAGA
ncbi:MAG: prohead protease/major capsid protein fusion protein [Pseudomonadota bacterium]